MNTNEAAIKIQKAWFAYRSWCVAQDVEYERDGYSPQPNYYYEPDYSNRLRRRRLLKLHTILLQIKNGLISEQITLSTTHNEVD
jgi:hypothetical protein